MGESPVPPEAIRTAAGRGRSSATAAEGAASPKGMGIQRVAAPGRPSARAVQCYLLLGARLFQQSMRNALAPLLVFMAAELQIGTTEKGALLSAIAAGYLFTQVPGGALADKLGSRNVISACLALSAVCCLAIPDSFDAFGIAGLWVTMAAMGAVQGPLFPTSTVFLSRWMPRKTDSGCDEKAWGTSMLDIGISIGSLVVIPIANTLAEHLGWRGAYRAIGLGSLAFAALWHALAADEPGTCRFISAAELQFLRENVSSAGKSGGTSGSPVAKAEAGWLGMPPRLLLHPGLWAIFFSHIAFNFGAYYMTNWNPTYYAEVLGVPPSQAKLHLMMPHITNLASKSLNPVLVAEIDRRGYSLLSSRRLFTAVGFVGAALTMLPVYRLRSMSPWVSTFLFSVANACFGLAPSGFKSNYLDITLEYVGVISGYGNTLGTVASWVGPQLVAIILQHIGSWDAVLVVVALVNCLAAANYVRSATVSPIEADSALLHAKTM
mmetsp:Transcript_123785/g.358047  ORF Transcript_123785/g.358047 Transcript_123785/m.358047 type:complete len:493 (-) Transcript_123785:141-1619(-)